MSHIYIYNNLFDTYLQKKTSEQVTVLFCDIDGFEVVESDLRII